MHISNKILKAINEGVMNALVDYDDDINVNKVLTSSIANTVNKQIYSLKLQELLPNPTDLNITFITQAVLMHELYGATYNPHLNGTAFKSFIRKAIKNNINGNLNWIDTSEVTKMNSLFENTQSQFDGDISEWDVSNVVNADWMFYNSGYTGENGALTHLKFTSLKTMKYMFADASYTQNLNWLNFVGGDDKIFTFDDVFEKENVAECIYNNMLRHNLYFDDFMSLYIDAKILNNKRKGYIGKVVEDYILHLVDSNENCNIDILAKLQKGKNWSDEFYDNIRILINNNMHNKTIFSDDDLLKALIDIKKVHNEKNNNYVDTCKSVFDKLLDKEIDANSPLVSYLFRTLIVNGNTLPIFNSFLKNCNITITKKK